MGLKAITLMYHDVVELERHEQSGFSGADAAAYKVAPGRFDEHLARAATARSDPPMLVGELLGDAPRPARGVPWMLTFDDGGASALAVADRLERRGWRAHFFITGGRIGSAGFVDAEQVRELDRRGHVVGLHSQSHPLRMAALSWHQQVDEWRACADAIAQILGRAVTVASIPGGLYSADVARTATLAGVRALFTSEPTTRTWQVGRCLLFGRYALTAGDTARGVAAIAAGARAPRWRQLALWKAKGLAKSIGGSTYLELRRRLFERRAR